MYSTRLKTGAINRKDVKELLSQPLPKEEPLPVKSKLKESPQRDEEDAVKLLSSFANAASTGVVPMPIPPHLFFQSFANAMQFQPMTDLTPTSQMMHQHFAYNQDLATTMATFPASVFTLGFPPMPTIPLQNLQNDVVFQTIEIPQDPQGKNQGLGRSGSQDASKAGKSVVFGGSLSGNDGDEAIEAAVAIDDETGPQPDSFNHRFRAGRPSCTYDTARRTASFIRKFKPRQATEEEWTVLKPYCIQHGVQWVGRNALKRTLAHVMKCSRWGIEYNDEAKDLLLGLVKSKYGLDNIKANEFCEMCRDNGTNALFPSKSLKSLAELEASLPDSIPELENIKYAERPPRAPRPPRMLPISPVEPLNFKPQVTSSGPSFTLSLPQAESALTATTIAALAASTPSVDAQRPCKCPLPSCGKSFPDIKTLGDHIKLGHAFSNNPNGVVKTGPSLHFSIAPLPPSVLPSFPKPEDYLNIASPPSLSALAQLADASTISQGSLSRPILPETTFPAAFTQIARSEPMVSMKTSQSTPMEPLLIPTQSTV